MLTIKAVCPSEIALKVFSERVEPLFKGINYRKEHLLIRGTIRDALMPKLLSGEIRIKDVERFVEDKNECFSKSAKHKIRRVDYDREKRRNYKNFRTSN
ncbi:MAG: hypothetical protein Q6358_15680 [Candidatus Brocadiales bacterium]|nr:hypothetical protein [Candidatus Brocadiales bacterium]